MVPGQSLDRERQITSLTFMPHGRFHFVPGNATNPPDVLVDEIYSLASPTAPGAYQAHARGDA